MGSGCDTYDLGLPVAEPMTSEPRGGDGGAARL